MTFVPLISSFLLKGRKEAPIEERRQKGFTKWYYRTAKKGIEHRKVCLAVSLLFVAMGVGLLLTLKTQFFPKDLQYFSYLDIWLPENSPLSATLKTTAQVETMVQQISDQYGHDHKEKGKTKEILESMTAFVGGGGPRFWSSATPEDPQTNYAEVILRTKDKHDTSPLLSLLQTEFDKKLAGATIDTRTLETGSPVGIPVQIRVSGEDLARLHIEAAKLEQILRDVPIARRVRSDWATQVSNSPSMSMRIARALLKSPTPTSPTHFRRRLAATGRAPWSKAKSRFPLWRDCAWERYRSFPTFTTCTSFRARTLIAYRSRKSQLSTSSRSYRRSVASINT